MNDINENLITIYGISDTFPQASKAFKQLQLQDTVKIPHHKPYIEQIASISSNIEIINKYIVDSVYGKSYEGQILTGKKLVIEGKLHHKLEYVAALVDQPVHSSHFLLPFSTFIVLGEDADSYSEFDITGYIEDIYIKQTDIRNVFINVLFVLNVSYISNI